MEDPAGTLGVVTELFLWVGVVVGCCCLLARAIVEAVDGTWVATHAVVLGHPPDLRLRWMAGDGVLRERELTAVEQDRVDHPEQLRVFYSRRAPHRVRFERTRPIAQALRTVGMIFLGLAGCALLVSVVALLVEG